MHVPVPRDTTSSCPPPPPPRTAAGVDPAAQLLRDPRLRSAGGLREGIQPKACLPARPGPPPHFLPSQPPRPRSPRPTNLIAEVTSGGPGGVHNQSRHRGRQRRPMGIARGRDFPRPSLIEVGGRAG